MRGEAIQRSNSEKRRFHDWGTLNPIAKMLIGVEDIVAFIV